MKRLVTFVIWLTLIATMCSCGVGYHLRRAAFHKKMAVAKGAEVDRDTLWKEVTIKGKPLDIKFTPQLLRDSMHFEKDGVKTTVVHKIVKQPGKTDTVMVYVNTYVPPKDTTAKVPHTVQEVIKKPPNSEPYWFIGGFCTCALLVGLILSLLRKRERG